MKSKIMKPPKPRKVQKYVEYWLSRLGDIYMVVPDKKFTFVLVGGYWEYWNISSVQRDEIRKGVLSDNVFMRFEFICEVKP